MMKGLWPLLGFVIAVGLQGKDANAEADRVKTAVQLADTAMKDDGTLLGRVRVDKVGATLTVSVARTDPRLLFGKLDNESIGLEALIRSQALRRDIASVFGDMPDATSSLNDIDVLAKCLVSAKPEANPDIVSDCIETKFQSVLESLRAQASSKNLSFIEKRDALIGFKIDVSLKPDSGKLFMMPYLRYRKCLVTHQSAEPFFDVMLPGRHTLIGRYHYRTKWTSGTVEEQDISFSAEGTATFTPPVK